MAYIRKHVVNKDEQHPVFTNIVNARRPLALLCALVNAEWCKQVLDDEDTNIRGWRQPPVPVAVPMSVSAMMSYRVCDELATETLVKRTVVGVRALNFNDAYLDAYYVKYHLGNATVSTPLVADDENSLICEMDVESETSHATGDITHETNNTPAAVCVVAI